MNSLVDQVVIRTFVTANRVGSSHSWKKELLTISWSLRSPAVGEVVFHWL